MFFQMSFLLFPQINLTRTGHVIFKASWQPGNISLKSRIVLNLDLTTYKKNLSNWMQCVCFVSDKEYFYIHDIR